MHSSEGIETFLSMPCCPVWAHISIIVITVLHGIGDFFCFTGTNFCDKDRLMFLFRELIFAIFSPNIYFCF